MSKQQVRVGIQTNQGSFPENYCTSQFVYRIYTRGATRHPVENVEKFIKDLKGAGLNGGLQLEQSNLLLYSTIT